MHTELTMHHSTSVVVTCRKRDNYAVTYVVVTDKDGNTHTLKAFHDEQLLEQSILEEGTDV